MCKRVQRIRELDAVLAAIIAPPSDQQPKFGWFSRLRQPEQTEMQALKADAELNWRVVRSISAAKADRTDPTRSGQSDAADPRRSSTAPAHHLCGDAQPRLGRQRCLNDRPCVELASSVRARRGHVTRVQRARARVHLAGPPAHDSRVDSMYCLLARDSLLHVGQRGVRRNGAGMRD